MSDIPVSAPSAPVESAPAAEGNTIPNTEQKAPTPAEVRKFKLKVDGQEWEADEEEVKKFAQIGRAKEKRFEESARIRKEAEEIKANLKKDWVKTLQEQGISREDIEKYLGQELKREMMTPEERERMAKDEENASLKQKLADIEAEKERAQFEREQKAYEAQLEQELPKALENHGLPRSPATLKRIGSHMLAAMEGGYDMSLEEAVELTKMELKQDLSHLLSVAGKYDDLIPPTVAEKLMQAHLAKVKSAPSYKSQPQDPSAPKQPQGRKISEAEWKKMFNT
jgi:hypothetical protein